MRCLSLLVAALALGACATSPDTGAGVPTITYASTKPPVELKDCVVKAALRVRDIRRAPPPVVIAVGADYRITFLNDPRIFARVRPTATGSRLKYYRRRRNLPPASQIDGAVESCS